MLSQADDQRDKINQLKPKRENLSEAIHEKLMVDWTYNSNVIEGSSLSLGDTMFFLREGLTVEGKPFKDFLDARNHAEAIEFVFDVVTAQQPITESLVRELNALLLAGVRHTIAVNSLREKVKKPATPGKY